MTAPIHPVLLRFAKPDASSQAMRPSQIDRVFLVSPHLRRALLADRQRCAQDRAQPKLSW